MTKKDEQEKKQVEVMEVSVEQEPIWIGIATTDIVEAELQKGDKVFILEDQGADWLTENGLVSKQYLLLQSI
jgi:hypothetical protein